MKKVTLGIVSGLGFSLIAAGALAHHGGDKRWDKLDANGDGEVTAAELDVRSEGLLEAADADGNGSISKAEMKAHREARRAERRAARNPDKNADGVVDRTEFMNAAQARFDRMDKNGDGVLSEDERKRRGHRRHGRHGNDKD